MEEILKKFKEFLSQIARSEEEADELRGKIESIPGGRKQLFKLIDKDADGSIGAKQIFEFCWEQGLLLNEQKEQILGKYFRAENEPLTFEEFCMVIKPKGMTLWKPLEMERIKPTPVFCSLVNCVLNSYEQLQKKRNSLSQNLPELEQYFSDNYSSSGELSKQILQTFLRDEGIYSRTKFEHIISYVYGEYEVSIPWKVFLPSLTIKQDDLKKSVPGVIEENETNKNICSRVSKKEKRSNTQMDEVLNQIDELQKALNDKKNRLKNRQEELKNSNKQAESRATLAGEVANTIQKLQKQTDNLERNYRSRVNFAKEPESTIPCTNINALSRKICKSRIEPCLSKYQEASCSRVHCPCQHEYRSEAFYDYLARSKQLDKNYLLGRSTSEAQLKIKEIQHRAMNKYLSRRQKDYLPTDSAIPYYYYNQYKRSIDNSRKFEDFLNQTGMIKSASNSRLYSYVPRQQHLENRLYNDSNLKILRPMTPHYLRY